MLTHDPGTIMRMYFLSSRAVTDVLAALAFPLTRYTSVHMTPLNLLALRHVLKATNVYERATKTSHAKRRVITLLLLSVATIHWMAVSEHQHGRRSIAIPDTHRCM